MIRLIDPVTFVVPGTAGAHAPMAVEKFGAKLRPNFTTANVSRMHGFTVKYFSTSQQSTKKFKNPSMQNVSPRTLHHYLSHFLKSETGGLDFFKLLI